MTLMGSILNVVRNQVQTQQTPFTKQESSPCAMTGRQLVGAIEKMLGVGELLQKSGASLLGRAALATRLDCGKATNTDDQTLRKCYNMQSRLNNMLNLSRGDEMYFPSSFDPEIMEARFGGKVKV